MIISDISDMCALVPENRNGYMDADGCPDELALSDDQADTDNDGIRNSADECPSEPETWNKFADDDGCPDSFPEG